MVSLDFIALLSIGSGLKCMEVKFIFCGCCNRVCHRQRRVSVELERRCKKRKKDGQNGYY